MRLKTLSTAITPMLLVLGAARGTRAQTTTGSTSFGLAAGFLLPDLVSDLSVLPSGSMLSGHVTRRMTPRFAAKIEGLVAKLGEAVSSETPPCPSTSCPASTSSAWPHSVAAISANLIIADDLSLRTGTGPYYVLGGGYYGGLHSNAGASPVRAFWSAGIGTNFRLGQRLLGAIEVKYQQVPNWVAGRWSLFPVTFGITW